MILLLAGTALLPVQAAETDSITTELPIINIAGKDKINLSCNCLGGEMLLAYTAKYGTDKLNALQFTETVAFGSELVDDTFSGRIDIDPAAVVRFFGDDFMAAEKVKFFFEHVVLWFKALFALLKK